MKKSKRLLINMIICLLILVSYTGCSSGDTPAAKEITQAEVSEPLVEKQNDEQIELPERDPYEIVNTLLNDLDPGWEFPLYQSDQPFSHHFNYLLGQYSFNNKPDLGLKLILETECYEAAMFAFCKDFFGPSYNEKIRSILEEEGIAVPEYPLSINGEILFKVLMHIAELESPSPEAELMLRIFLDTTKELTEQPTEESWKRVLFLPLHEKDQEILERFYPKITAWKEPGTFEYDLVKAPALIKEAICNAPFMLNPHNGLKQIYTEDEAIEIFSDFVPTNPQKGGYILTVADVNSPREYGTVWVDPTSYQEDILFCASDPNEASIKISEIHTYNFIGQYNGGSYVFYDAYLQAVTVRVFDLVTGEMIFDASYTPEAKEVYNSSYMYFNILIDQGFPPRQEYAEKILPLIKK